MDEGAPSDEEDAAAEAELVTEEELGEDGQVDDEPDEPVVLVNDVDEVEKARKKAFDRARRRRALYASSAMADEEKVAPMLPPARPTMDQELLMEEQEELELLRAMLARNDSQPGSSGGGGSSSSSHQRPSGLSTDRTTGRWCDRSGRSLPGRWNASPYKPAPYSLRGLVPHAGLSRNEPWAFDIVDSCARLELRPSTAYATSGLSRLDDGMNDDVAMLRRRRKAEDHAASVVTNRPAWDATPWHYCPPSLVRMLRPSESRAPVPLPRATHSHALRSAPAPEVAARVQPCTDWRCARACAVLLLVSAARAEARDPRAVGPGHCCKRRPRPVR